MTAHEGHKVVSPTRRPPLPPRKYSWYRVEPRVMYSRKDMSMENSNYSIRNRTRDLPACGAVPQRTAPRRARSENKRLTKTWMSESQPHYRSNEMNSAIWNTLPSPCFGKYHHPSIYWPISIIHRSILLYIQLSLLSKRTPKREVIHDKTF